MKERKELQKQEARKEERVFRPPVYDVREEDGKIVVRMEMPGVDKDGVEISVEDNTLTVVGHRKDTLPEGAYLVRERRMCDYRRVFTLDETVDPESIEARLENGVLFLTLQVKESAKPKKIEVKTA
ncbi:Hsp20/alpha crystallin family protein [Spirochaeta thermophila]|uniref:Heat shock protein Hsp20 n=2 Tax=Winmispira thermophila TaxID=154 RepID=G0GCK2_WINT7|nr:Hsp20/alpha crystallin family protein [Spirochaeta thermophila]ADN02673.1 putative heat shock protein [Spirochaeta thermophila DSM 6192]AEJ62068.1 heat shock protein Hsp20 [Spirochaeta thermophila DSM 6578]